MHNVIPIMHTIPINNPGIFPIKEFFLFEITKSFSFSKTNQIFK